MKEALWLLMMLLMAAWLCVRGRRKPSRTLGTIDAIVPAYNEGPCLEDSLRNLLANPYIGQVICIDDGSTDDTPQVLARMQAQTVAAGR